MEMEQTFKIEIEKEVEDIINWFTHNYEKEISGWLVGEFEGDLIKVTELLIPHQEVGGASVDTDGKALIKLRKEYGNKCLKIIGHFHSHNTMTSHWSGVDETFISQYMESRERGLFIVSSKKDGHLIRMEIRKPINLSIDNLDYGVLIENDILGEELKKVIDEKVTESKTIVVNCGGYGGQRDYRRLDNINTSDEINKQVSYNQNHKCVLVSGLTYHQFGALEDLGEHEERMNGGKWDIVFKVKDKKERKRIIKEVKEYLNGEAELNAEMNNPFVSDDWGY